MTLKSHLPLPGPIPVLLAGLLAASVLPGESAEPAPYFADDGASNAVHDLIQPQAAYFSGRTFVVYQGKDYHPYITYYDHRKEAWAAETVKVGENPLAEIAYGDDHGAPAIAVDAKGYLHVFYGSHITPQKYARSARPADMTDWEEMDPPIESATYPMPMKLADGTLALFLRKGGWPNPWLMMTSEDRGESWSDPETIVDFLPMGVYVTFVPGLEGKSVHAAFVHQNVERRPEWENRRHTFYMRRDEDGVWRNAEGESLTLPVTEEKAFDQCLVWRTDEPRHSNAPGVGYDEFDRPYLLIIDGHDNEFKHRLARWSEDDEWVVTAITETDHFFDNTGAIDPTIRGSVVVYLISEGSEQTANKRGGNVQKWRKTDFGGSWKKEQDLKTYEETGDLHYAPRLVRNAHPHARLLFGTYPAESPRDEGDFSQKLYLYGDRGFVKAPSTVPSPADGPFFTSLGEDFDLTLNHMWRVFGAVNDGTDTVNRFGNEPAWFEWMPRKLIWSNEYEYRSGVYNRLVRFPISDNGYVWSWGSRPDWPTEPGAYHQENNAKYILGAYRHLMWTRDERFLEVRHSSRVRHEERDVSADHTMLEKVRMAMRYQLHELGGGNGLLVIDNDHNTGLPDGAPTNYWDNFPFGYMDGYTNIYFYASVRAMAEIEEWAGDREAAVFYEELAEKIEKRYRQTFWDDTKGRFIGNIDIEGAKIDLGFTFLNLEALAYGLGGEEEAESVFAWLDGDRILDGDTSQGEDIYHFGFAPRATTVDVVETGEPYWWKSVVIDGVPRITVEPGGTATFGEHLENGGAIFYVSHYDLMARAIYLGADNAWGRFSAIMDEFRKDDLRRNPVNDVGAGWKVGVAGVFPESGLVPATFLYAFLGIEADLRGLNIRPNLPSDLEYAGVRDLSYGGGLYTVRVRSDRVTILPQKETGERLDGVIGNLEPDTCYLRLIVDSDGETRAAERVRSDDRGELTFDLEPEYGTEIRFFPCDEEPVNEGGDDY